MRTRFRVFGSENLICVATLLVSWLPFCHLAVKHFDLTFDSSFKLYEKISAVVKSSFFQLMIAKVKTYPSLKDPEKVIRPLITSRIDYCNALYVSLD